MTMNSSGRSVGRPAASGTPVGSVSPVPFPTFSPSPNASTSSTPAPAASGRIGVNNTPLGLSGSGRSQPAQVSGTPQLMHGVAAGRGSPLPPRPLSGGKTTALGASRFTGALSPVLETPARSSQHSLPMLSPPPSTTAATPSGRTTTPAAGGSVSGGSKSHRKRQTPGASGQVASNPVRTAEVAPVPRRKKRKPTDKQIPERVVASVPESAIYNQLLELEKRVDATLARKKLEIQEALRNPPRVPQTLRIYVSCTHEHQASERPDLDVPSWTLCVSGRILEEDSVNGSRDVEGSAASKATEMGKSGPKTEVPVFSNLLKRLTVNLDPSLYPEKPVVSWEAGRSLTPVSGFEIKRAGKKEFVARIQIELNYVPQKYELSPKLVDLLGVALETRPRVTAALWQYIKSKKLQAAADPTVIVCDAPLQEIFGEPRIKMSLIASKLHSHLTMPSPITIEYPIKLSSQSSQVESCYDVTVDLPMPLQKEMSDYLTSLEKHRDINTLDELIARDVRQINEHRKRRAFFLGFSQSPVDFIYGLMASQHRDLRQAGGDTGRNMAKERHSDLYKQPWVEDAVLRYLNRRPAAGIE